MIVDIAYYLEGARQNGAQLDLGAASGRSQQGPGFVLVAVSDPTPAEMGELAASFRLPSLAVEDALDGHQRPKLERHGDHTFLAAKTVRYDGDRGAVDFGELDVFLGPRSAVVVAWHSEAVLAGARANLEDRPGTAALGPIAAAWSALDVVVDAYGPVLDRLTDDLEEIEQAVFQRALDQGERIYLLRREAARLVRALSPLLEPFEVLEGGDRLTMEGGLRPLFRDVGDHVRRAYDAAVVLDKALDGLLNANLAGVTVRQNMVIQKVSGWAAIAAVPTVITGIYGMNFEHMPELGWPAGYPLVLLVMVAAVVGLRRYFKHSGWI